jgi:hypothetical protein
VRRRVRDDIVLSDMMEKTCQVKMSTDSPLSYQVQYMEHLLRSMLEPIIRDSIWTQVRVCTPVSIWISGANFVPCHSRSHSHSHMPNCRSWQTHMQCNSRLELLGSEDLEYSCYQTVPVSL